MYINYINFPNDVKKLIICYIIFDVKYSRERYLLYKQLNINVNYLKPLQNLTNQNRNLQILFKKVKSNDNMWYIEIELYKHQKHIRKAIYLYYHNRTKSIVDIIDYTKNRIYGYEIGICIENKVYMYDKKYVQKIKPDDSILLYDL